MLTYNAFGPNNVGIRARKHIKEACSVVTEPQLFFTNCQNLQSDVKIFLNISQPLIRLAVWSNWHWENIQQPVGSISVTSSHFGAQLIFSSGNKPNHLRDGMDTNYLLRSKDPAKQDTCSRACIVNSDFTEIVGYHDFRFRIMRRVNVHDWVSRDLDNLSCMIKFCAPPRRSHYRPIMWQTFEFFCLLLSCTKY